MFRNMKTKVSKNPENDRNANTLICSNISRIQNVCVLHLISTKRNSEFKPELKC